jgi:streptogramin lyase
VASTLAALGYPLRHAASFFKRGRTPADKYPVSWRLPRNLIAALASTVALVALPASAHADLVTGYSTGLSIGSAPADITTGPDGNLWFTQPGLLTPGVGRITPDGDIDEFPTSVLLGPAPTDIVGDQAGGVWFTLKGAPESIGRIDTTTEQIDQYAAPAGANVTGLDVDNEGNLWFAEADKGMLGKMAPDGNVQEFDLQLSGDETLKDVAWGPDGWIWFTVEHDGGQPLSRINETLSWVGRMAPDGSDKCRFPESGGLSGAPNKIVAGSDDKMYFTIAGDTDAIGRVKMDGTLDEFEIGTTGSQPAGIAEGGDKALWFTGVASPGRIARMTKSQAFTDFAGGTSGLGLLADAEPIGITRGPDGNVWFTERGLDGRIAKMTVPPVAHLDLQQAEELIGRHEITNGELKATVTGNTQDTSVSVKYGEDNNFDMQIDVDDVLGSAGADPVDQTVVLPGLEPLKHYRAKVVATNGSGEATSNKVDFWTDENGRLLDYQPEPPVIDVPPVIVEQPGKPADTGAPGNSDDYRQDGNTPAALRQSTPLAPPVLGQKVVVRPLTGAVRVKTPGSRSFTSLGATGATLPVGSVVDTRAGKIVLHSARDANGRTQKGTFWGGVFQIRQKRSGKGMTDLMLRGGGIARCGARASISVLARESKAKRRVVRRLWGKDKHSRFRTHGRDSVATVRGTKWVTTDRCDGTRTRVTQGAVMVRDLHTKRRVLVRAGHAYLARHRHR